MAAFTYRINNQAAVFFDIYVFAMFAQKNDMVNHAQAAVGIRPLIDDIVHLFKYFLFHGKHAALQSHHRWLR